MNRIPLDTTPEGLAALAAEHPELWPDIDAHPNAYPALREWIAEQRTAAGPVAGSADPSPATAQPATAQPGLEPAETGPHPPARRRRLTVAIAASTAAVLVLGGGTAALALTGTWPFGSGGPFGGADDRAVAAEPASFAAGLEQRWAIDAASFETREGRFAEEPLSVGSSILFVGQAFYTATVQQVDAESGETIWEERTNTAKCASDFDGAGAVCALARIDDSQMPTGPTDVVTLTEQGEASRFTVDGFWDELYLNPNGGGDQIVLRHGDSLLGVGREGDEQWWHDDVEGLGTDSGQRCDLALTGGADLVSGPGCGDVERIGDSEEPTNVLSRGDDDRLTFVSDAEPLYLHSTPERVAAYDASTGEERWAVDGRMVGPPSTPQIAETDGSRGLLVAHGDGEGYSVVDLRTGDAVEIAYDGGPSTAAVAASQVLVFAGDGADGAFSRLAVFDAATGAETSSGESPALEGVVEVSGRADGVLVGQAREQCEGCADLSGVGRFAYFGARDPDAKAEASDAARAGSDAIPDAIPASCPADTILLAWAELADGWVLVCGVTLEQPSYVAYQPVDGEKIVSEGARDPAGEQARAAVQWDAELRRYTATMANGSHLTLDYGIGTATLRDGATASAATIEQQRSLRMLFVIIGDRVRTAADVSEEEGAFSVRVPKDTAEDQIRYMIEVLEQAYAGREMLKGALPALQSCSYGPGGYGSVVTELEGVRDNRAAVLRALETMPVDQVPEGLQLLDELRDSIRFSYEADLEYIAWAHASNASGCASLSAAGHTASDSATASKQRFAAHWNGVIATEFGVRTFDASYI